MLRIGPNYLGLASSATFGLIMALCALAAFFTCIIGPTNQLPVVQDIVSRLLLFLMGTLALWTCSVFIVPLLFWPTTVRYHDDPGAFYLQFLMRKGIVIRPSDLIGYSTMAYVGIWRIGGWKGLVLHGASGEDWPLGNSNLWYGMRLVPLLEQQGLRSFGHQVVRWRLWNMRRRKNP